MNHPELLVIPILMLLDYTLTILGAKTSAAVYRQHFKIPSYELNPLWRKSVDQIHWFNPRHFFLVVLVTAFLVYVDRTKSAEGTIEFLFGMLFGAFGAVCMRHLSNLLTFLYVNRFPNEIDGEVQLSMKLIIMISQFNFVALACLFGVIAVLVPNPYIYGISAGLVVLVLGQSIWAARAKSGTKTEESST